MIPREELKRLGWYKGEGRCVVGVAMWDGAYFVGLGQSFGHWDVSAMEYGDKGFSPIADLQVEPLEACLLRIAGLEHLLRECITSGDHACYNGTDDARLSNMAARIREINTTARFALGKP